MNILNNAFMRGYGHLFGKGKPLVFESHLSLEDAHQRLVDLLQSSRKEADFSSKFVGSIDEDFVYIQYMERVGNGVGSTINRAYTMFKGKITQSDKGNISLVGYFTVPMSGKLFGLILAVALVPLIFISVRSLLDGNVFSAEMAGGPLVGFFAHNMLSLRQRDIEQISDAVVGALESTD